MYLLFIPCSSGFVYFSDSIIELGDLQGLPWLLKHVVYIHYSSTSLLPFPVLYLAILLVIVFHIWVRDPAHDNDYFAFRNEFTI